MRFRSQLLIATVLLIGLLTGATLLILQATVRSEVRRQVDTSLTASLQTFEAVQHEREQQLSRTAALLSELPTLKALVVTRHAETVQDGSTPFWKLAGSDLFILAAPDGEVLALHEAQPGWTRETALQHLRESMLRKEESAWWFDKGRLYWVFLRPLTAGEGSEQRDLGVVAIGYEVNASIARELARSSGSEIALTMGSEVIASTVSPAVISMLQSAIAEARDSKVVRRPVTDLGPYAIGWIRLRETAPEIRCFVLVPLLQSQQFLRHLNRITIVLGLSALVFGAFLFSVISTAITRPLENVLAGVRALAAGDFEYRIDASGSAEAQQLGTAFSTMRTRLLESQEHKLAAERVSTLSRTASSVSHDLRHYLAAVVANAEFLHEAERLGVDRDEIYREIQTAADQMTELIDSLKELSREEAQLCKTSADMDETVRRAVEAVRARPEFRSHNICVQTDGDLSGVFDQRKMERVFFNLVLNACEAVAGADGQVVVHATATPQDLVVRVRDNGTGIPSEIRTTAFDPFVSAGKVNGTGLGLAIVSRIVSDHHGTVVVESTGEMGTIIRVVIPRSESMHTQPAVAGD